MATSGIDARVARQRSRFGLFALCVLCGCGGGDQNFGPTTKIGTPSSRNESAAKPVAADKDLVNAETKAEPSASDQSPSSDPKIVAEPTPQEASSRLTRESTDPPTLVVQSPMNSTSTSATDLPVKDSPENSDKNLSTTTTETPAVARTPLSPELREWLLAKRRQTGGADGLSVLSAADLSKVSWHDLRTGQLSHEFFGQNGLTTGLAFNPARRWIMGASEAGWLRLWTIESSTGLDRFARESRRAAQALLGGIDTEQEGIWALAADRQGKWFLCGGADGSLRLGSVESVAQPDSAAGESATRLAIKLGAKLPAHEGTVTDLEISTNGEWVASGGSDHRVCLWDAKTGTTTRTWTDSPAQITDVGLSADGKIVAASCLDKFVRWWPVDTTQPPAAETVPKPVKTSQVDSSKGAAKATKPTNGLEHPDLVLSVAVSSDGHFVATGSKDKLVRVWDLASGQIVEKHDGPKDAVVEVRFLEGDQRLFIRDRSGVVRIKPRERRNSDDDDAPLPDSERPFQFITPSTVLSADRGPTPVASDNADNPKVSQSQIALRNATSHEARAAARQPLLNGATFETDDDAAKAEQVAKLEKQLANTISETLKSDLRKPLSRLKTVPVSQERTERPKLLGTLATSFQFFPTPAPQNRTGLRAVQLAIHGDAELLTATVSSTNNDLDAERHRPTDSTASQLWVWDIATRSLLRHWDDARSDLGICEFLDSTNHVVSSSGQVFSLPTGESRALSGLAQETISAVAASPDGRSLAVGYAGSIQATTSVLRLFDSTTLQEMKAHEAFEGLTTAIAFSPDGTSLAVAIRERQLHRLLILDAMTLAVLATIEEQSHPAAWRQGLRAETRDLGLMTLRFSIDGRFLLTHGSYGSGDYRLTLWQKKGAKWTKENAISSKSSQPIVDDAQPPTPLWFIAGRGAQIAAINSKGLGVVDTSNGRLLRSIELKSGLKDRPPIAWSADGTWLAQGDETGQVTLWNLRTDKDAAIFPAQLGPVKALALSADGLVLATLGEENKLHLWNLENWQPKNRIALKPKAAKSVTTD